jgi:hypothetical protein
MDRKKDILLHEPTVDSGEDVRETQMLKGKGKFSKAQLDTNTVQPYASGAAPACEPHGGMNRHPGTGV